MQMKPSSVHALAAAMLATAALAGPTPASALDFSKTPPVVEISDGQVSVGSRTVKLPPGHWTFVSYAAGRYRNLGGNSTPRHTGYFADAEPKRFHAGLVVELGEIALRSNQWDGEPCKADANVYKSTLDSTPLFPQCLLVSKWPSLHKAATAGFYKPVSDWLAQQGIDQSVDVIDIRFLHYMATGQGLIRVFVPASAFATPQAAVDWAKALPPLFGPFLEGRTSEVTLPALP